MQPRASRGNKPSTFDKGDAELRGLPEGSRSEKTCRVIVAVARRKTEPGQAGTELVRLGSYYGPIGFGRVQGVSGEAKLAPTAQETCTCTSALGCSGRGDGHRPRLAAER